MRVKTSWLPAVGALALSGLTYACVGDSENIGTTVDSGADSTTDGGSGGGSDGGGATDGSTADVFPTCMAKEVLCGHTCAILGTSDTNCGACGHDCGGGKCTQGACQSVPVVTNVQELAGFAVDQDHVYYSTNNANASTAGLFRCAVTGCAPAQSLYASQVLGSDIGSVYASGGLVGFVFSRVSAASIAQVCPETGCVDGGTVSVSSVNARLFGSVGTTFFAAGGKFSSSIQVATCVAGGASCSPATLGPGYSEGASTDGTNVVFSVSQADGGSSIVLTTVGAASAPVAFIDVAPVQTAIFAGNVYSLVQGPMGGNSGHFDKCPLAGCSGAPDVPRRGVWRIRTYHRAHRPRSDATVHPARQGLRLLGVGRPDRREHLRQHHEGREALAENQCTVHAVSSWGSCLRISPQSSGTGGMADVFLGRSRPSAAGSIEGPTCSRSGSSQQVAMSATRRP
jgi:hypothetical protein